VTGRRRLPSGERGVALVLTLLVLMTLTGLALAFLSTSALEPRISRNLGDAARARYLAEAGIEVGYNTLVAAAAAGGGWSALLAIASAQSPWVALPALARAPLPGLPEAEGTYSVSMRNDSEPDGPALTGEAAADPDAALDANGVVIVRSTGSFRNANRTIDVVVKRPVPPPPAPGASVRALCTMSNWREL